MKLDLAAGVDIEVKL